MTPDLRLAIPAASGWIAAAVLLGFPHAALPALIVAWLAAGMLVFLSPRLALCAAAIALCATSIALHGPSRHTTATGTVDVIVTTTQTVTAGDDQFEATLDSIDGVAVRMPALVFGIDPGSRLGIGTALGVSATLAEADPGDDRAQLVFARAEARILSPPPWYLAWAEHLRAGFLGATDRLPGAGGDLLAGLAIGDTTAVGDGLDRAMKTSSLSHLTAVSGANCAIVIGLVMLGGAALGWPRWLRVVISIVVLLGFVVLVTPEPSVLRAAVMAALVLVALARGRPVQGLPVLAAATLTLVIVDPWLARNYGFVLSVLATGGLLLLAGPIGDALSRWLPRGIALALAIPIAAQLACQPVIVLLDASLPTYGVVANLLAAPAAPIATVVGLAACVALAIIPPVGVLLAHVAWLPSAWIAAVAHFFASAPLARLPWPDGVVGVLLLAGGGVIGMLALRRAWARVILTLGVIAYLAIAGGVALGSQLGRPADWQIAGCDVGQGDAFVVRSGGEIALIDTGPEPEPLRECLTELGIDRIDLLVLTHYDLDHVGGVDAVVGRVDRALVGPAEGPEPAIGALLGGGAAVEQVGRGPSGMLGDLRWTVLWPAPHADPGNDASIVVRFEGESLTSIFLGDLGEGAQQRLLRSVGPVDVVKVSHHGSSDQAPELYERVHATVGLIGVGADNGYGHPTSSLLDLLAADGTAVARTDTDGLVLVSPGESPGTVHVWTER